MDQQAKFFTAAEPAAPVNSKKLFFWILTCTASVVFVGCIIAGACAWFWVTLPTIVEPTERALVGRRCITLRYCTREDFNNQGVEEITIGVQIANFGDGHMDMPGVEAMLLDADGNRYAPETEHAKKKLNPNLSIPIKWTFRVPKSLRYERIEFLNPRINQRASIRLPSFSASTPWLQPDPPPAPPQQD